MRPKTKPRDLHRSILTEMRDKTKSTVKVASDGKSLTYRRPHRGNGKTYRVKVSDFCLYRGCHVIVDKIDLETLTLEVSDSDGKTYLEVEAFDVEVLP